ncbi:hypothetical protein ACOBR2_08325 [Telmatobacter bradus]|uniref:hypothetical protein n=1 Tax=Telmatobacter bradus TaxID=474953 RepID=UPI003B4394F4
MDLDALSFYIGIPLELILVLLQIKKRSYKSLPIFFAYSFWSLLSDSCIWWISKHVSPPLFLKIYLIQLSIDSSMIFLIMLEIVWGTLRPIHASLSKYSLILSAILIGLLGLCFWPFSQLILPGKLNVLGIFLFRLEQTMAILRVFVFVVLTACSHLLRMNWKHRELQIATGFGAYSLIALTVSFIHSHQSVGINYHWLDFFNSLSYEFVLGYWVVCFAQPEAVREQFSPHMQNLMRSLAETAHGNLGLLQNRKK